MAGRRLRRRGSGGWGFGRRRLATRLAASRRTLVVDTNLDYLIRSTRIAVLVDVDLDDLLANRRAGITRWRAGITRWRARRTRWRARRTRRRRFRSFLRGCGGRRTLRFRLGLGGALRLGGTLGLRRGAGLARNNQDVVAAAQRGGDAPADGGPRGPSEADANLGVGDFEGTELVLDAFEGLVEGGEVDVVAVGAGLDDDGVDDDEGVAVDARLARAEADVAELGGAADHGLHDDVALAAAGVVVDVAADDLHGMMHGGARVG